MTSCIQQIGSIFNDLKVPKEIKTTGLFAVATAATAAFITSPLGALGGALVGTFFTGSSFLAGRIGEKLVKDPESKMFGLLTKIIPCALAVLSGWAVALAAGYSVGIFPVIQVTAITFLCVTGIESLYLDFILR